MLDFLVRAYVPHAVLAAVAALLFHSQPAFPDETWAKTYEPLRERTAAAADRWGELNRRLYQFARNTPQWREVEDGRRQAEQECRAGHEALRPIDERLAKDREPVYRARRGRALLLCVLIVLCYVLTNLLVSPAGGMRLLPDAPSYAVLVVGAFCVPQALLWLASGDPARASVLLFAADGLALTVLLFARDAYGAFAGERAEAERLEAQALAGAAGARREVERFYAGHQDLLGDVYPEALFRSALTAAIPDGTEPVRAWEGARALIEQMQTLVAQAQESRRVLREQRQKEEDAAQKQRAEMDALRARIDALAGAADDEAEEERATLRRQLARLQGQPLRNTITPDDL